MRYTATLMSEFVIALIAIWIFDNIFLAGLLTVMATFLVYHVWDSFFNMIEDEKLKEVEEKQDEKVKTNIKNNTPNRHLGGGDQKC